MAIIDWPADVLIPTSMDWSLKSNGATFESKFNGSVQTVEFPGSVWQCKMTFTDLDDEESRYLESIIFQLGISNRVRIPDFGRYGRPAVGLPRINGASQNGYVLKTRGWTNGALVLKRGDYISFNDELKMVLADVTAGTTGLADVPIAPMIRVSPANLALIEVVNPRGLFGLEKPEAAVSRKSGISNDYSISLVERYYV